MPVSRSKLRRMCIIYSKLKYGTENKYYYTKKDLINFIEKKTGYEVCASSVEKDMQDLRLDFDLEIEFSRYKNGYFINHPPTNEEFKDLMFNYLKLEL